MNSQGQPLYRLGNVEIDTLRLCLRCDDEELFLRQKSFQVLLYLIEQRDRLIPKNELIEHVWRGTAVTDNALDQCLAEIRKVLGDDSRNPRFIRTVPRAGYRFIGDVNEIAADETTPIVTKPADSSQRVAEISQPSAGTWVNKRTALVAVLVIVAIAVTAVFLIQRWRSQRSVTDVTLPQTAGKRTVAVMFFDNQSGSADLDWLREGLADMLITDLSRSNNLTILSRQQLRTLLDRAGRSPADRIRLEEALEIAQKSKAAIVIMGSFSRLGEQVRIDAQLHDARDGQLLAAERLVVDQPAHILTQVDLLAIKLASHLGGGDQFTNSGLTSVMTSDLAAYRCYSLAVAKIQQIQNQEAIALLEKAIAIDPDFAMAYARIGYTYAIGEARPDEAKPYLEKAFKLTQRLTEKDKLSITAWYAIANRDYPGAIRSFQELVARHPLDVENYRVLARVLRGEERLQEAIEILKQAMVIDSEAKDLYNELGGVYSELGRHDESIAMRQRYVQLAPQEANAHDSLGLSHQWAGRYEEAVREYERALTLKPDFYISVIHLGNTRYQQGRYREALQHFHRFIELAPVSDRSRGYASISALQRARGRLDLAEVAARQSASLAPASPQWSTLTVALEKGDLSKAENFKQKFEKLSFSGRGSRGNLRESTYFQGLFALKSGRGDEAVQKFKEALGHLPLMWHLDPFEDCLANTYLELGRFDEAIAEYERILKLNPNYPLAHYHLAQAYERKGQPDQARAAYGRFLEVWKDADGDIPEVVSARKVVESAHK